MADRLDLVILGATGFTGIHCIPYIHKLSKANGRNLKWGVSGRSEEKLKEALQKYEKELGDDLKSIPIIVADIMDYKSLREMAEKTKVVINCCGPYRFLGDVVVTACIAAGTHHVDVSGEPEFLERVQVEQDEAAREKGVYVVSACGLDSIPTDLGVIWLEQQFEGTLNSIETYLELWSEGGTVSGSTANYGTWHTAVESVGNMNSLKEIRKKLYAKKLPTFEPKLKFKNLPHKSDVVEGWIVPFPGADRSVAKRTQTYMYEAEDKRPVQVATYFVIKSFLGLVLMAFFGFLFVVLSKFSFGRKLLLSYPAIFSGGVFDKKPPREENIEKSWFSVTFYGEGWKEKLTNKDDKYTTPVDSCIVGKVKGKNPGYGSTCLAVVLAGIVVLTETEKLAGKGKGGVYPPGAAFAKTSLVKQLDENGLTFEIIARKDLNPASP